MSQSQAPRPGPPGRHRRTLADEEFAMPDAAVMATLGSRDRLSSPEALRLLPSSGTRSSIYIYTFLVESPQSLLC